MQSKNKYRVIIDTNIFINFLLTRKVMKLDEMIESGDIRLIYNEELLNELLAVMGRPKMKTFFGEKEIQKLLAQLKIFSAFSVVKTKVVACRDPKEDFFLSLAKQSRADFIVTNNKDLLMLEKFEETKIVTLNEFYNAMAETV